VIALVANQTAGIGEVHSIPRPELHAPAAELMSLADSPKNFRDDAIPPF